MRAHVLLLVALLVAQTLVAGCAGERRPLDAPVVSVAATGPSANQGILLRVLVITDEYFPVPDAKVSIVGLGVNGTTDDWGDAYFHFPAPGRYALHVHRAGYYPNQSRVVLEEDRPEQTLRVRLTDAPRDAHFADYYFYNGICGPTLYVAAATPRSDCGQTPSFQRPEARFILGRGLVRGFLELSWEGHPAGAAEMRMEVRFPDVGAFADGSEALVAEGASPVRIIVPDEMLTERHRQNGNVVSVFVGLSQREPVALNAQQEFQIDGEFDYFVAAPQVDPRP